MIQKVEVEHGFASGSDVYAFRRKFTRILCGFTSPLHFITIAKERREDFHPVSWYFRILGSLGVDTDVKQNSKCDPWPGDLMPRSRL